MKIQRQGFQDNLGGTWLGDFADNMLKKSYNTENLTSIRDMSKEPKKFGTIEEKMIDIKSRIGFELLKEIRGEDDSNIKLAAEDDCACPGQTRKCSCDIKIAVAHSKQSLDLMTNILKYIKDLIKDRHQTLTPIQVISECRENLNLRFDSLSVNMSKLNSFIEKELSKYNKGNDSDFSYSPRGDLSESSDPNQESEFWSHAFPR